MSDLGFVLTRQNAHVQVIRKDDGGVSLVDLRTLAAIDLCAAERDQLREMLDRAAMPGQRVNHGPECQCTPCLAEPSYVSRREAAAVPHIVTDPDAHRRHGCPTCLQADA